jgi:hypothetical protein
MHKGMVYIAIVIMSCGSCGQALFFFIELASTKLGCSPIDLGTLHFELYMYGFVNPWVVMATLVVITIDDEGDGLMSFCE